MRTRRSCGNSVTLSFGCAVRFAIDSPMVSEVVSFFVEFEVAVPHMRPA